MNSTKMVTKPVFLSATAQNLVNKTCIQPIDELVSVPVLKKKDELLKW